MSHVSPKGPNTVPETPPQLLQRTSSSVTPTYTGSIHEPATNAQIYSPDVKTPTTPFHEPDLGDIITPGQDTSLATPATAGSESTPSLWSKRKPVPGLLVLPSSSPDQTVPASHPFARSVSSPRPCSIEETASTPLSPRHGPLPPRRQGVHSRNVSLNRKGSPLTPTESTVSDTPGLFWAPQAPIETSKSGAEIEMLKGDGSPDQAAVDTESSDTETARKLSSTNTTPDVSLSTTTPPPALPSQSASPTPANTVNGGQHPLRMRFDKSLPALPLDEEAASPSRPTHRHARSTSSSPSTQLVTPRSTSHQFVDQSPDQETGENGRTRLQWSKRLGALTRSKTSKAKAKETPDGHTINPVAPVELDEDEAFSVDRVPSKRRLWEAGTLFVTDENGDLVCFGDMFPKMPDPVEPGQPVPPIPKTAVFFIRHFWCGQCQDYMFASLSQLDPEALEKAGIKVIIISNGSWKIIKSYRELFKCPFPIYVDGPRKLYQLMGMTKMTNDFGPLFKGRAAYHQRSVPKQLLAGGKNALTKMPLANPGKLTQLGGEFVLSPGYNCDFAHRMTNTSNHMEAPDVLREAGCPHPTRSEVQEIVIAENQKAEFERIEKEMREWRAEREAELERIRRRRAERRGEVYNPTTNTSRLALGLDNDEPEQARVAIPVFDDAPSSETSSPSPTRPQSIRPDDDRVVVLDADGPVCLPLSSMEDVLAWEPESESKAESVKDILEMDQQFTTAMRELGINLGPEIKTQPAHNDTFGRKVSGTGNGLEVTENR